MLFLCNCLDFLGRLAALALGLLGEKVAVDVREDTTLGNSDVTEKLVQFFVVADGKLKVTGDDTTLLVITGSVTGQFEDFGSEVFKTAAR